jgi:hypothetical protein
MLYTIHPLNKLNTINGGGNWLFWFSIAIRKGKAVPVTGREGPWRCERSRLPHLLESRLIDGGKVVSLARQPPFNPQENSWYSFLLKAELPPVP